MVTSVFVAINNNCVSKLVFIKIYESSAILDQDLFGKFIIESGNNLETLVYFLISNDILK